MGGRRREWGYLIRRPRRIERTRIQRKRSYVKVPVRKPDETNVPCVIINDPFTSSEMKRLGIS